MVLRQLSRFIPSSRLLLVGVLAAGGAYAWGLHRGQQIEAGKQAEQDAIVRSVRDAAIEAAAVAISEIKIENTTIRQELEREIRTVSVYSECEHTDNGLLAVNSALTRRESAHTSILSGADPVDR
jgi:hypothetical protein